MLMMFEEPERSLLRTSIARVGLAKATVVAPAIERLGEWRTWLQCAREMSTVLLQAKVSEALDALPGARWRWADQPPVSRSGERSAPRSWPAPAGPVRRAASGPAST